MNRASSHMERSLARFAELLSETVFAEETASAHGVLQRVDPRVKTAGLLLLVAAASLSHSITVIAGLYAVGLMLAGASRVFSLSFLRRVWLFMPLYTAIIALPALFLSPGQPLLRGPGPLVITRQGAHAAAFLVLRVATSVSLVLTLVLTTSWPALLKALRTLGLPRTAVLLLLLTYRYIHVLLTTTGAFFLARQSRKVGPESREGAGRWIGAVLATLLDKSYRMSQDVYLAMQSRGFRGEPVVLDDFRLKASDGAWFLAFLSAFLIGVYLGVYKP
jgi:cobalt/nickel transport system permease protein